MIVDKTRRKEKDVTAEEKSQIAAANHIWVNAFSTVSPTNEFCAAIGRSVLDAVLNSEVADDLSGSFPITWIRVNAS